MTDIADHRESSAVVIGEIRDATDLHRVLRARAEELQITRAALDDITGLACGYTAKLLSPGPMKKIGFVSLGPMLGGLAVKLLVVEDPVALAKVQRRLGRDQPRAAERARSGNCNWEKHKMKPRYRVLQDHTSFGLAMFNAGAEISWDAWPKVVSGRVEPANESARRIFNYWSARHGQYGFPDTPRDPESGEFFLPAHLPPDPRSTRLPALPAVALDGMPRYRSKWRQSFGGREVQIGEEFFFCGWPPTEGVEPVNDVARQVVDYLEAHRDHPKRRAAPWDEFSESLYLPELPEIPMATYARDLSMNGAEDRDTWADQINQDRVDRAVAALKNPPPPPRAKGSRRRVSA